METVRRVIGKNLTGYASFSEFRRVQRSKGVAKLPTHEERRAIIEAPLGRIVVHPKLTWGGVFMRDRMPVDGRRVHMEFPEDEEWCRSKWEEK